MFHNQIKFMYFLIAIVIGKYVCVYVLVYVFAFIYAHAYKMNAYVVIFLSAGYVYDHNYNVHI